MVALKVRKQNPHVYKRALNGTLPKEIRILDVAEVSESFDARKDCKQREYHYFFLRKQMDIEKMRVAAEKLKGSHDFRNFCKINVMATTNFVRYIMDVKIGKVEEIQFDPFIMDYGKVNEVNDHPEFKHGPEKIEELKERHLREFAEPEVKNPFDQFYIRIKSNAFLWHQIRCIVTILFQIGKGLDEEKVMDDLLNIEKMPSRPGYHYADPRYLTLTDCVYDPEPFDGDRYVLG